MSLLHSMKGSSGLRETGREPRRRRGVATKRGLSKEQVHARKMSQVPAAR